MNSRTLITIVLAIALMVLVMGAAAAITFTGMANRDKWTLSEAWTQPAANVQSLKVTNLTGSAKTDLFVQAGNAIQIYDASGKMALSKEFPGTLAATMGDVNGDGTQDIIAYYKESQTSVVTAIKAAGGETIWKVALAGLGDVGRAAAIDLDGTGKSGVVVGDLRGKLVALSNDGKERWRYDMNASSDLRGLDNIITGKAQLIAAADMAGNVVVLNGKGQVVWSYTVADGLRRLRTYELTGPGQSDVLLGSETGTLYALQGSTGKLLWSATLGQAVTEIRLAELDGDPGTREVVAGGKGGGVWAYSQAGARLFAASVGGKVTEIAALDADGTGHSILAIGDEDGGVTFFDSKGNRLTSKSYQAPVNRILGDKFMQEKQFIVADAAQMRTLTPAKQTAPFWYSPLLAGLLACVVIAVAAFVIGSIKPAPPLQISAEQMSVEAQKARRIMLHESIDDLKRMKGTGEIPPDAYLARMKDLRAQLADAEANLIKLGVPLQAETVKCPNCGGTLQLGTDRCEYCGQVVIT
jgi:outer membrane protein assembly factor BamB